MRILPAAQIGRVEAVLFEPACLDLPNPLVYANFSAHCDAAARRSLLSRNLPRRVDFSALNLLRYPKGTLVYGDRSYLAVAGDAIVQEQIAPWCVDPVDEALQMQAQPDRAIDISGDCLLLARFGENTWGHWVAEMLAKAAVAERFFPGRFLYAVPWWTTEKHGTRGFADAVLESLAAYGILPTRLVRMSGFTFYRFAALLDIGGFWQDGLHPGALASLRAVNLPKSGERKHQKIAVLRRPPDARAVHNEDEISGLLRSCGFLSVDLATQSFAAQVSLFSEADVVVGSLGSNFTAALYAPMEKRLISVAPGGWADGYFIRMFQHIDAVHADVRGSSIVQDGIPAERAAHRVEIAELDAAIEAVSTPRGEDAVLVDGDVMPRRLGAALLNISFADNGNAEFTGAWSGSEPTHRWSLGEVSGLRIARDRLRCGGPLWLEIEGQGHVYPPGLPTRPLGVLVNGLPAGRFDVIGRGRYICRVTQEMLSGTGPVALTFLHPVCPSPRMMGAGADDRALGFGFEKLAFYGTARQEI